MASNTGILKRTLSGDDDETLDARPEKKPRIGEAIQLSPVASGSSELLVDAINVELSSSIRQKRKRSASNEPEERNLKARITVALTSSNPEPPSFLMSTITTEIENINALLSTSNTVGPSSTSPLPHSSTSSLSNSPASRTQSPQSSPQSSPDIYDRMVTSGIVRLQRTRQDPEYEKYFDF